MPKLTEKFIEKIRKPEAGQVLIRDTEIPGFGIRITPTSLSFILEKRVKGKPKRITLGRHTDNFTLEAARNKALELSGRIAQGEDPTEESHIQGEEITFADLCEMYLEKYAKE